MATPWNELVRLENSVKHPQPAQTRRRCPPYIALLRVVRRVHVLSPSPVRVVRVRVVRPLGDVTLWRDNDKRSRGSSRSAHSSCSLWHVFAVSQEGSRGGREGGRPSEWSAWDMGKQEQCLLTCGGVTTILLKLKLYRRSLPPKGKTRNVPIYRLPSFSRAVL